MSTKNRQVFYFQGKMQNTSHSIGLLFDAAAGTYDPQPVAGLAWVDTEIAGVGTGHFYLEPGDTSVPTHLPFSSHPGVIPGHEGGGIFAGLGRDRTPYKNINPGDRVLLKAGLGCGACRSCAFGATNRCISRRVLGVHLHGLMSPVCLVEPERMIKVPSDFKLNDLAQIDVVSVAHHMLRRVTPTLTANRGDLPSLDAIVLGYGHLGVVVATVLYGLGMRVMIVGLPKDKACEKWWKVSGGMERIFIDKEVATLEERLKAGIRHTRDLKIFGDQSESNKVDLCVDCTGDPAALACAQNVTARGGTIALLSTYDTAGGSQPQSWQIEREQTCIAVQGSTDLDYHGAIRWSGGAAQYMRYAQTYSPEKIRCAFNDVNRGLVFKALVDWTVPATS